MSWIERVCRWILHMVAPALLAVFVPSGALFAADEAADPPAIWLVTYGPGEIYWQRFGHNAIWIRDAPRGLDHVFNFGFFDFAQPNFIGRFVQGRMLYFAAAHPAGDEFALYVGENRSIRAQRLAIQPERARQLAEFLLRAVQPENRDYLYDYYLDNCSTRIRDALDQALDGRLSARFGTQPGKQGFRDHTRRLAAPDPWLYLGLEIVLGSPVDRPISRWEEFFIPGELANALGELDAPAPGLPSPLVTEDVTLFASSLADPPSRPVAVWPRYLILSLVLLLAAWGLARLWGPRFPTYAWLVVAGIAGAAMTYFWLGTNHAVAAANLNLALFNPLWLLILTGRAAQRGVGVLLLAGVGVASLGAIFPGWQHNTDVLIAFGPLNVAAAWVLLRRTPGQRPGVLV